MDRPHSPIDSALAFLREILPWCLPGLLSGTIVRVLLIAHFPYGYVHPDSADFLLTADRYLNHHRFVLHGKKAFLGPVLFLLPMIVRLPSLLVVPWAQHLFGLVCTLMIGALVRCWTTFWKWWIIPATVLAGINPSALYYEHSLIAESQYLWCVTALVLAGTAYALAPDRSRFILLLLALLLTAGSRPEGKLYVLFCLVLVPLVHWAQWRAFALRGSITLAFCALTWLSTRNTEAGMLLYATVLPLAPEIPRSAPDFAPVIAPLREQRVARGPFAVPDVVAEERRITAVLFPYLISKYGSDKSAGNFCQRLAIEAATRHPFYLPFISLEKFLQGTQYPDNDGFGTRWLQTVQLDSCTYKSWMLPLMHRLTGRPIHTAGDVTAYLQEEFTPIQPDWFDAVQRPWLLATTGARVPCPGLPGGTPGMPLFYILGAGGVVAGFLRPGPMRKVWIAWSITLGFVAFVVMLTGPVIPRFRLVFEPFVLLYLILLADTVASLLPIAIPGATRP